MKNRVVLATAFALCVATRAFGLQAQNNAPAAPAPDQNAATRAQIIDEMVQKGDKLARIPPGPLATATPFQATFGTGRNELIVAYLVASHVERTGYRALLDVMEARVDKQIGAAPSGTGSTSLTSKGLVPEILGVAVESGALTEDVKGTVLTFRATPTGVAKALQGEGLLQAYADYSKDPALRFASRFSVAASFDASRGQSTSTSTSTSTFTGDSQQLTNWSVRGVVINGRDPASSQYAHLWRDLLKNDGYQRAAGDIDDALSKWKEFTQWEHDLRDAVAKIDEQWAQDKDTAAAEKKFKDLLVQEMPKLGNLHNLPKAVTDALDTDVAELARLEESIGNVYDFVNRGVLVTFDFSTARDITLPDLYTATGVIEAGLGASRKTDFTLNVAASVYKHTPANASQAFKSFDLSAQLEHPLGASFVLPSATAALSARYSYLPKDTVSASAGTSGTAASGSIFYVQGKVTLPIKGSGVKVPLSVTASNRTELIKEANVRGSVGLTFDLDTFMTALGVKSK